MPELVDQLLVEHYDPAYLRSIDRNFVQLPSFNAQAFGGDTANLTLSARLRGLSPNQALVLVNGKRRHTTGNLAVLSGVYQGAAAADLGFIPMAGIGHIEVLTDGAAAQYGTDAIAGVDQHHPQEEPLGRLDLGHRRRIFRRRRQDGRRLVQHRHGPDREQLSEHYGREQISRLQQPRPARPARLQPGQLRLFGRQQRRREHHPGLSEPEPDLGRRRYRLNNLIYNAGIELPADFEVYSFGTWATRTPRPTRTTVATTVSRARWARPTGPSRWASPSRTHHRRRLRHDLGVSGKVAGWDADLSSTYGKDDIEVRVEDSANASLYTDSSTLTTKGFTPTSFHAGSWRTTQWTNNLDLRHDFEVGFSAPMNVAFGAEQRRDTYRIGAGDAASTYKEGSQSYPGFSKTDAGGHARTSWALYTDVAATPITAWKIDAAFRYEKFSDFGDTTVAKLTSRYDFNEMFAIRGTVSTGFRAPTLAESYYSATNVSPTSAFVQLAPNSNAARLLGIDTLKPEKSTNYSLGFVAHPIPKMTATIDAYQIKLKNRIFGSSSVYGIRNGIIVNSNVNAAIAANGNILDSTVTSTGINIFSNGATGRSICVNRFTARRPASVRWTT
jgi:iron complex outermembrane receptor protein